jgi:hypothetical protein
MRDVREDGSMKPSCKWILLVLLLAVSLNLAVFIGQPKGAEKNVLVAKKVVTAPALDGVMEDVWKQAPPLTVKVVGGRNLPKGTEVTLRALYAGDTVYFLVQYADPTQSFRRAPWQKQSDGSWKNLKDPNDKGGDNNLYYEDKFAWIWNISTPDFEKKGCLAACHTGEGKPYGNKYTPKEGQRLDMWHYKSVRTGPVGQIDDQYVADTRYDKEKSPNAGRKSDPKTGGGYTNNETKDKKGPEVALKGNKPAPPYWILESEKEAFDDSKYKAGDEIPSIVVAPFAGDRADVATQGVWKDGVWTLEIARKLQTGSEFDVQFSDLEKAYAFGVAVFDNAQVRHAYSPGVHRLQFK